MTQNFGPLKSAARMRSILQLVRQDLVEIWINSRDTAKRSGDLPVVAVDWSELFGYAAAAPSKADYLPTAYGEDSWSLHYAGLSFLFYKLPCRILLLPPYIWEMRNYLDLLRQGIFSELLSVKSPFPSGKFSELLQKLRALKSRDDNFAKYIESDGDSIDLNLDTIHQITEIASDYIPSLFFQLQESTSRFLEALNDILYSSDEQRKRIFTIEELDPNLPELLGLHTEEWLYWLHYMNSERNRPRQNKADALALAYLEKLHHKFYWEDKPLLFATRSKAMFTVMSYHPGSFPPGRNSYLGDGARSFSSARSWEYFAEVGYYLDRNTQPGDLSAEIDRKIRLLDLQINAINRKEKMIVPDELVDDHKDLEMRWERLRGSYDLDGLGDKRNWQSLKGSDERLLVKLVKALLSPRRPAAVADTRAKLAAEILGRVDQILVRFPSSTLTDEALIHLDSEAKTGMPSQFSPIQILWYLSIKTEISKILSRTATETATTLITKIKDGQSCRVLALKTLEDISGEIHASRAEALWLAAISYYALGNYKDASFFFTNWTTIRSDIISAGPALITAGLNAECLRNTQKIRLALIALEKSVSSFSKKDRWYNTLWHNLRARFIIEWIEPREEDYDNYPYDVFGSITDRIFRSMADWVLNDRYWSRIRNENLKLFTINNLLYGVARCLRHDEKPAKWISERIESFLQLAEYLDEALKVRPKAQFTHTLGYFYLKFSVVPASDVITVAHGSLRASAVGYLEEAMNLARIQENPLASKLSRSHLRILRDREEDIVRGEV